MSRRPFGGGFGAAPGYSLPSPGLGPVDEKASAPSASPSVQSANFQLSADQRIIGSTLPFQIALSLVASPQTSVGDAPPPVAPVYTDKVRGSMRASVLDPSSSGGDEPAQPGASDAMVEDAVAGAENVVSPLVDPDYTGGFTPNGGTNQNGYSAKKWSKYLIWGGILVGGIWIVRRVL